MNPEFNVQRFRNGGSYAASLIWSMVGIAAGNEAMRWPLGLRGAKVTNPGWADEYNDSWP